MAERLAPGNAASRPVDRVEAPVEGYASDPEVAAALSTAAAALRAGGYEVDTVELPHFEELARLFRQLVAAEETLDRSAAIERDGDEAVRTARRNARGSEPSLDFAGYRQGFGRRLEIAREWNALLEDFPLLLLPVSFRRPVPVDHDQGDAAQMQAFLRAQHPLLAITALGLPALAVPLAAEGGLPTGVQLVSRRFREDLLIDAAEAIEASILPFTPIEIRW